MKPCIQQQFLESTTNAQPDQGSAWKRQSRPSGHRPWDTNGWLIMEHPEIIDGFFGSSPMKRIPENNS